MACPTIATMSPVQDSIANLITTILNQSRAEPGDLINASTASQNACISLQHLEQRQSQGTQYLPDVEILFRKTSGMLDILEKVLQDHVNGESGSEMLDTVSSLSTVFQVFHKTADLITLYNETLEIRDGNTLSGQMEGYCRVVQEAIGLKSEWQAKCKGKTFNPEPIAKLLDTVNTEAKRYLMPASFSLPLPSTTQPGEDDAPPAYDTVFRHPKDKEFPIDEKAPSKHEKGATTTLRPSASMSTGKKSPDSTTLNPQQIMFIPRRSRQNEKVRVSLTPESSRMVVWSVDCIELYCSGTSRLLWRLASDDAAISNRGVPCLFSRLNCLSPDGSLMCFTTVVDRTDELVMIRASDGRVLGKQTVIASRCASVSISNSNNKVAVCFKSAEKVEFGNIIFLPFDISHPAGKCFSGEPVKMPHIGNETWQFSCSSRFTPDDSHLVVAAEWIKPVPDSPAPTRVVDLRVFEAKGINPEVSYWEASQEKFKGVPTPFHPEFIFPRNDSTGKHKWLLAWNGDNIWDPSAFKLGDIAHKEIYTTIREGDQGLSFRQVMGTITKSLIYSKVRCCEDGTWTHIIRRGKKGQGKICLTRGRWDKDGLSAMAKRSESPAAVLVVGADDDWEASSDGRLAVTYNKEKGRVELWSL